MFSLEIVETNEIKPRRGFCFSFGFVFLASFNVCFLLIYITWMFLGVLVWKLVEKYIFLDKKTPSLMFWPPL